MEMVWYLTKEDAEEGMEYFKANPVRYSVQGEMRESVSPNGDPIWGFDLRTWRLD